MLAEIQIVYVIDCLGFDTSDELAGCVYYDGHMQMYDVEGKSLIGAMSGHARWVLSVDVSPGGAVIATGNKSTTLTQESICHLLRPPCCMVFMATFRPCDIFGFLPI